MTHYFKVVVYNHVARAKYTYKARFESITAAIDYYTRGNNRVIEVKELRVKL